MDNKLSNFDPVKFSPYTDHAVMLRGGLVASPKTSVRRVSCYSQQQWKNILAGKSKDGTKQILKRDPQDWPTYDEICTIEGLRLSHRSDSYDFLCIQIPNTIIVGNKEVRTNPSYVLTPDATEILQDLLVCDFKRALVDWEIGTQNHCISSDQIIQRGHMNTLERFLMRFDIPISSDGAEKKSMRRQLNRWLEKAKVIEKAYRSIDIEYEDSKDKVVKRKNKCL